MNFISVALFKKSHANVFIVYLLEILIINLKIMEQHFQDLAQKVIYDNNLEYFSDHFAKTFTQKPIPQQCCDIMSFGIISMVNPIGLMKTWGK